jgi:IgA Peptidase M64
MRYGTVNDTRYGGAGGAYAAYAGGNSLASELALHEVAHSFASLADEYGGNSGFHPGPEPGNVNVTLSSTGNKWSRWLGHNQPGIGVIGAYQGGDYYDQGVYRPSNNSKMRNLNQPFDAVSREQFILRFYNFVDPLDAHTPNGSTLTNPTLSATRIDPATINLEWFVNGSLVTGATGALFNPRDYGYGPGSYTVMLRAYDPTGFDPLNGWVRYQQSNLEQTVSWNVLLTASRSQRRGL